MEIGIIGAGIAGLASAIRLASKGHQVTVFEANDYPGGKLSAFTMGGYRFDAGPSLFTMPQYVDELFSAAGENPVAHFSYRSLDKACKYFWDDGTALDAWTDPQRFAAETETNLGIPASQLLQFLQNSRKKYERAGQIFLEKSLHKANTWMRPEVFSALGHLPSFDLFTTMHSVHERWFSEAKMVQLFDRYATYNGSNPYKAPGMLTIIPHFEHGIGAFYPEGGMHAITESLYQLALRKGVQFRFNTRVQRIRIKNGAVEGLLAGDMFHPFQRVVSNMDVWYTYKQLLPDQTPPERILNQPKSSSALIFYWGIERSFPELGLHNIFFSNEYRREFEALEQGAMIDDPTVYVNITSKCTPGDAPKGCENWFVLVNAPCNGKQNWPELVARTRANVLRKLSARLGVPVEAFIREEALLDPAGIEQKTSSHLGALYGYSSNNPMAAFLRHPNFSRKLRGLYFVGGSVHPGGGIPLCLLSAKITSELLT